jgi:CIC family chloride channel protein
MGNGYSHMQALLAGGVRSDAVFLLALLAAKVLATAVTSGGRTGAGLFAPSLFVGAVAGTLVGAMVQTVWPGHAEAAGAYGMVGMGAVAAAVLHAPITMTLMLFEMTGNYAVILPLLLALATAGAASAAFRNRSLYDIELDHLGLTLARGREELVMYRLAVRDVMRGEVERLHADAPLAELVERFLSRRVDEVFVVDAEGRLVRVVDIQDVKGLLGTPSTGRTAADVQTRPVPSVHPETPLAAALPLFFDAGVEQLPVLDQDGVLVGVLAERDVVAAYDREVLRHDARLARIESTVDDVRQTDFVELPPGQVVEVVEAGAAMAGRTLRELALPHRHGCTVVAVSEWDAERGEHQRRPADLDRKLDARDRLVLVGSADGVARLSGGRS